MSVVDDEEFRHEADFDFPGPGGGRGAVHVIVIMVVVVGVVVVVVVVVVVAVVRDRRSWRSWPDGSDEPRCHPRQMRRARQVQAGHHDLMRVLVKSMVEQIKVKPFYVFDGLRYAQHAALRVSNQRHDSFFERATRFVHRLSRRHDGLHQHGDADL